MADKYIDHDETKIYGDHAAKMICKLVVGIVPEFDAGMEHLAVEIADATAAVLGAVTAARSADAAVRAGSRGKVSALDESRGRRDGCGGRLERPVGSGGRCPRRLELSGRPGGG